MKIFNRQWTRNIAKRIKQAVRLLCIPAVLLCGSASAQTAIELFNPAAREYIVGNTAAASNLVSSALMKYPDDEKLQKLKELIEQQQEQQDQKNQDQQNQDQQNQDQQNQDQQDQQNQDPQEAQPSPAQQQAGQMSEEEAQQLLDAMKLNEKDQRTDLRPFLGQPVRVDKDW
jgi:type IV secretory pathway VirB10-like protein